MQQITEGPCVSDQGSQSPWKLARKGRIHQTSFHRKSLANPFTFVADEKTPLRLSLRHGLRK